MMSIDPKVIIDSRLSHSQALRQNPDFPCPQEVIDNQGMVTVRYWTPDGAIHQGQIVVHKLLMKDVRAAFRLLLAQRFPITSAIPIADSRFRWDDETSMLANNSSGFNYRYIARTRRLSNHALGRAIDINPRLNPFIRGDFVQPTGAVYDPSLPGALTAASSLVLFFKGRGWIWGGDWEDRKDYQHFERPE